MGGPPAYSLSRLGWEALQTIRKTIESTSDENRQEELGSLLAHVMDLPDERFAGLDASMPMRAVLGFLKEQVRKEKAGW